MGLVQMNGLMIDNLIEIASILKTISSDLKELKEQSKKDGDAVYKQLLLLRGI